MSDGDRGERPAYLKGEFLAIAVLAGILLVGLLSHYSGRQYERRTYEPHQHAISAADAAQQRCAGREAGAMAECIVKEVSAAEETARNEQDLQAQQHMALWALLMVIVSAATVGVTVWALTYIKETLDETRKMARDTAQMARESGAATAAMVRANEISNRIAEAELRPYLMVDKISLSDVLDFNSTTQKPGENEIKHYGSFVAEINIHLQNAGKVPAREITVYIKRYYGYLAKARFWNFAFRRTQVAFCGPGKPRRLFMPMRITSSERQEFDNGVLMCILRVRLTFKGEGDQLFSERAAYWFSGNTGDTFYLMDEQFDVAGRRKQGDEEQFDFEQDSED